MARTGKIARLPHDIREQLNHRLRDGEEVKSILEWLNPLPEVQAVLSEHFDGRPINHVNVTDWRQGGYADWLVRQDALTLTANLQDQFVFGDNALADKFNERLARWLAIQYAASAQALVGSEQDQLAKWSRLRQLCADVSRLRRGDLHSERLSIERDWLALESTKTNEQFEKQFWAWTKRPEIQQKINPDRKKGISSESLKKMQEKLRLM